MQIRVYYEDTDSGGVVYHSNYLKFCERARSELFFQKNINIFSNKDGHFLMARANCAFLYPARLGDLLLVKTKLTKLKHASLEIEQEIFLKDKPCFKASFLMAFLKANKPKAIPKELKAQMQELFYS